jgi:AAA ATPase-like protein
VQVSPLGPVPVKGLSAPVEVGELVGAGPARTRLQALAARGLTPFVGRQAELAALQQSLAQAGAGHGQVVAVVGDAGVGKTRLFHEFTQASRTQGWSVLESRSASYGQATPYLPVMDLLKAYCQLDDRDDGRRIREKLSGRRSRWTQPWGRPCRPSWPSWRCRGRTPPGGPSTCRNAASAPWRPSHACACGRAGCSPSSWSSRTCTGSMRRRRHSSTARSRAGASHLAEVTSPVHRTSRLGSSRGEPTSLRL